MEVRQKTKFSPTANRPLLRDIRLGTDLEELVAIRAAAGGGRTMTTWDPEFFPGGEAFWLHGIGDFQETAFVIAARLFRTNCLKASLESLRICYDNPISNVDILEAKGAPASVKGQVVCDGNLWINPLYRGYGFPGIAVRLLHTQALLRWPEAEWFFGLVETRLVETGVTIHGSYPHTTGPVIWKNTPYGQDFTMQLCWASRREIVAGLHSSPGSIRSVHRQRVG